jgi:hypothetical protein
MYVQVDLAPSPPAVSLEEPEDCKRFHLAVVNGESAALVFGALVDAAAGRLEGDHAWITVDAVRRMAEGRVGPGWDADFEAMLAFAGSKGWLDPTGASIQAHVEWQGATGGGDGA